MPSRSTPTLVHLIRDVNDDLWKNPFNHELEGFVSAVRDVLVPIMADVERYGLKRWHLHKHTHLVERFYKTVIVRQEYKCEVTQKYQKRLKARPPRSRPLRVRQRLATTCRPAPET